METKNRKKDEERNSQASGRDDETAEGKSRKRKKIFGQSPIIVTGGSFIIELGNDLELGDRHLEDIDDPPKRKRFRHEDTNKHVRGITIHAPGARVSHNASSPFTFITPREGETELRFTIEFDYS